MPTVTAVCATFLLAALNSCPPPPPETLNEFALWVTWYDPALCDDPEMSHNCDSDPTHTADMTPVTPALYGKTAACPPQLLGSRFVANGLDVVCRDTGTAVNFRYKAAVGSWGGGWVLSVDVMAKKGERYDLEIIENWKLK